MLDESIRAIAEHRVAQGENIVKWPYNEEHMQEYLMARLGFSTIINVEGVLSVRFNYCAVHQLVLRPFVKKGQK